METRSEISDNREELIDDDEKRTEEDEREAWYLVGYVWVELESQLAGGVSVCQY